MVNLFKYAVILVSLTLARKRLLANRVYSTDHDILCASRFELFKSLNTFWTDNDSITVLEIGFSDQHLCEDWENWFSDIKRLNIVSVGPNYPDERPNKDMVHYFIEIESVFNGNVLNELCSKHGPFDIIVDNGGRSGQEMIYAMTILFPCLSDEAFYFIDTSRLLPVSLDSMGAIGSQLSQMFSSLHYQWYSETPNTFYNPIFSGTLRSIETTENFIILEKAEIAKYSSIMRGEQTVPAATEIRFNLELKDGSVVIARLYIVEGSDFADEWIESQCHSFVTNHPALIGLGYGVTDCVSAAKSIIQRGERTAVW